MVCILHVFMSKEVQEGMKTKTKKFMNRHNVSSALYSGFYLIS